MKPSEIKELIIKSLDVDSDTEKVSGMLEEEGVIYDFGIGFREKILGKLLSAGVTVNREIEFIKYMNSVFYRIALTGVAAIVLLLLSIFLMEGSLSFNSFLGLNDSFDESTVCLLTGN